MSTPSNTYNGTITEEVEVYQLLGVAIFSSTTFFVYSYLLLLGREIEYIWSEQRRPASWLYGLIRYPGLVSQLLLTGVNSYSPNCAADQRLAAWTMAIALVATYTFQGLRTYALCGQKPVLALVMIITVLPSIAMTMAQAIDTNCSGSAKFSPTESDIQMSSDLIFESVVFGATVWATWSQITARRKHSTVSIGGLADLILRNGVLYYVVFLLDQGCNTIVSNIPQTVPIAELATLTSVFSYPLRWAMSCQFLLELRERSEKPIDVSSTYDAAPTTATISFLHDPLGSIRSAIHGDFGEPVTHSVRSIKPKGLSEGVSTDETPTSDGFDGEGIELRVRSLFHAEAGESISA